MPYLRSTCNWLFMSALLHSNSFKVQPGNEFAQSLPSAVEPASGNEIWKILMVVGLTFPRQVIFTINTNGFIKDRKSNYLAIRYFRFVGIKVIVSVSIQGILKKRFCNVQDLVEISFKILHDKFVYGGLNQIGQNLK